jgi:hypothetical protein
MSTSSNSSSDGTHRRASSEQTDAGLPDNGSMSISTAAANAAAPSMPQDPANELSHARRTFALPELVSLVASNVGTIQDALSAFRVTPNFHDAIAPVFYERIKLVDADVPGAGGLNRAESLANSPHLHRIKYLHVNGSGRSVYGTVDWTPHIMNVLKATPDLKEFLATNFPLSLEDYFQ